MLFAGLSVIGVGLGLRDDVAKSPEGGNKSLSSLAAPFGTALVALFFFTGSGPGAMFRHSAVGAGRVELAELTPNQVIALSRQTEDMIVWERDGVESSVGINVMNGIAFIVNGKSDGAVVDDRGAQAFLGLLPAALHPRPKRAFVVGLGTGMTAGVLGRMPGVESVDVIELEPSVVEVARRSALANGAVLENPRVHLFIGDGREALITSKGSYDLVVSEPSNPYRAGVAALFTREYYLAGRARLAPGGLFAQWMQSYETDGKALGSVLGTLGSVFPYVSLWSLGGADLVLVGSMSPQFVDVDHLRGVLATPHYLDWIRRAWNVEGVEALLAHHIARPAVVHALAERMGASINTDDLNVLEYSFGRRVGDGAYSATRDLFLTLDVAARRPEVKGSVDWALVDDLRHRIDWTGYVGPPASPRVQATETGCSGSMTRAAKLWPDGEEPADIVEVWVVGSMEAIRGSDAALGRAEALERAGFEAEALLVRSRLAEAKKDLDLATTLLLQAFDRLRKKALPLCDVTTRAMNRARSLAVSHPRRAFDLLRAVSSAPFAIAHSEQYRTFTREIMGARSPDPVLCAEAFSARHGRATWDIAVLHARASCLGRARSPDSALAAAELAAFLANEPETFSASDGSSSDSPARDD
jgi:spermidine synthase